MYTAESQLAFEQAVDSNRLSRDKDSELYVGYYMYMGEHEGKSMFKHIITRQYIK